MMLVPRIRATWMPFAIPAPLMVPIPVPAPQVTRALTAPRILTNANKVHVHIPLLCIRTHDTDRSLKPIFMKLKPTTDNSWNSCKHVSRLSHKKKVHARELTAHVSQFVLFSRVNDFTRVLMRKYHRVSQSYSFYCKITRNTRNRFREVKWKNAMNLHIRFMSRVFSCYEWVSWPSCESSIAGYSWFVQVHPRVNPIVFRKQFPTWTTGKDKCAFKSGFLDLFQKIVLFWEKHFKTIFRTSFPIKKVIFIFVIWCLVPSPPPNYHGSRKWFFEIISEKYWFFWKNC